MLQALRGTLVVNKLGHLGQPYSEVIEYLALEVSLTTLDRNNRIACSLVLAALWMPCAGWGENPRASAQQPTEAEVFAHFRAAKQATQAGNIDRAVEEYNKVLSLNPRLVEARVNLGLAYYMLGYYDQAITELESAVRQRPDLLGANLFLGIGYLKLGFPTKAIPALQKVLRAEPSNKEARRALLACYVAQDNYREAAKESRVFFSLESDREEAWFRLGHDYLDMARRLAGRMSRRHQNSAWGYRLGADFFAQRRLWLDAVDKYRQALKLEPMQPGLHTHLGIGYLHLEKLEEAEVEFRNELQLNPENEQALLGLAEVQLAKGLAEAALESVSELWEIFPPFLAEQSDFPSIQLIPELARNLAAILEKSPNGTATHFLLSVLYKAAGEVEKANQHHGAFRYNFDAWQASPVSTKTGATAQQLCRARQYTACVNLLESQKHLDVTDNLLLGKTQLTLQQYERAADAFAAALAIEKQNSEAIYWLVRMYQRLAEDSFAQLEELFPESWRVHQLRAEAHRLRTAHKNAIKEYQSAVRLQPDDAELHEALGELYLSNTLFEEAHAELEKALELDPSRASVLYLLGRMYVTTRKSQKAIPYLQKALRYEPNRLEARAALGTAYMRLGQAALAVRELEKASDLDHYGNVHYLLYKAYLKLGKRELAQKALTHSEELRRASLAARRKKVAESAVAE